MAWQLPQVAPAAPSFHLGEVCVPPASVAPWQKLVQLAPLAGSVASFQRGRLPAAGVRHECRWRR